MFLWLQLTTNPKKNHPVKKYLARKCDKYHILPAWLWKAWDSDRAGHDFRDNKWKGVWIFQQPSSWSAGDDGPQSKPFSF